MKYTALLIIAALCSAATASAQVIIDASGTVIQSPERAPPSGAREAGEKRERDHKEGKPEEGKPSDGKPSEGKPTEGKPSDGKPGEEGKPGETKPDQPPTVTKRPSEPSQKPNPKELDVRPDATGKVAFSFRNQPWPQLLEWLAEISGEPLDWQELPGDYVNLASPGLYTVEETRDLFNRHLLARGYTLLRLAGGMAVVKTSELNPALVPAVSVEELATLPPYQFVRTVFPLEWLSAEKLAEELKPLVSTAGKLVPLNETNRIEALDAVVNLRRIAELLQDEQSMEARQGLAREFPLRYISAVNAKKMLEEFLGVGQQSSRSAMDPRQMQQLMQMMQERMGGGGNPERSKDQSKKQEPNVSIVANDRINSLIVHAPTDRMAIAAEFIKRIDVQGSNLNSLSDVKTRVQTFRLAALDPEKISDMLREMNVLEPTTKITVDEQNKALVVYGSAADRYVVQELITRLDGSGRKFSVLQLRRLDPQEVADSITFLMGVDQNKDENQSRYRYFGDSRSSQRKEDQFRVAANVRNQQVMLWANDIELEEVKNLLVKLGELPPEGSMAGRIRTIDASSTPETYEYLQRLKQQWQKVSPNPLSIPQADQFKDETAKPPKPGEKKPADDSEKKPAAPPADNKAPAKKDESVASHAESSTFVNMQVTEGASGEANAQAVNPQAAKADSDAPGSPPATEKAPDNQSAGSDQAADEQLPPIQSADDFDRAFNRSKAAKDQANQDGPPADIRIEVAPDGTLMLYSEDTEALNRLENLMLQAPPPKKPHTIFYVKHARASWVVLNLEDYFADQMEQKDNDRDRFYRWIFDMPDDKKKSVGLAGGAKLKFLSDNDTGSIIVSNASERQLAVMKDLIELWDVAEPSRQTSRFTKLVNVKYSKASTIADTVKEAYRDLLSSNDKAFAATQGGQGGEQRNRSNNNGGSDLVDTRSGQNSGGTSFAFKGDLSIGVDDVGNTLLISAKGEELLSLVCEMIDQLDEAAKPSSDVEVVRIPSGDSIESALRAMLGDDKVSNRSSSSSSSDSYRRDYDRDRDRDRDRSRR